MARQWRAVVCAFGIIAVGTALNYLWHSYTPTYVTEQLHLPLSAALAGSSLCGIGGDRGLPRWQGCWRTGSAPIASSSSS